VEINKKQNGSTYKHLNGNSIVEHGQNQHQNGLEASTNTLNVIKMKNVTVANGDIHDLNNKVNDKERSGSDIKDRSNEDEGITVIE
jgi:hypothetical protein